MTLTATLLRPLAVSLLFSGCAYFRPTPPPVTPVATGDSAAPSTTTATAGAGRKKNGHPANCTCPECVSLSPSPRLIVGRILAVDRARRIATIDLQGEAPAAALENGAELVARDYTSLVQTAMLRASRFVRGRTLGTTIVSGQPSVGDEVVWLAP